MGSAGSYNLATGLTGFGSWQANFTSHGPKGGSAIVNTSSAPNSLALSLTANSGWDATWEGFAGVADLTFPVA